MSLLDDENTIAEKIDKRLELEQQMLETILRLFESFNRSIENG